MKCNLTPITFFQDLKPKYVVIQHTAIKHAFIMPFKYWHNNKKKSQLLVNEKLTRAIKEVFNFLRESLQDPAKP